MSWTNAVITDAGHRLQAALLGTGKGLVFTRAVTGAGLAEGELAAQTAVTEERQTLSLQPATPLEDAKTKVQVLLSNAGLETRYTMHQLGFYAKAQDAEDEILYALVQDETGDTIPADAESPGFTSDWSYVFAYGNADSVTVMVDPAGMITWDKVGAAGGVAPLGPDGKVPEENLPETGAPADGLPTNDVRSYPVRDGESINAGDVVNVGRRVISGTTFGSLEVGSTVQIKENGIPVDYLVVHQGLPSDMYDESCNGTWLLRKDIAEQRAWDAGDVNAYADSDINAYLNGDWMNRYDETTLENIKQVKIPYCVGNGDSSVKSGADGLSVRAFLLGGYELGYTLSDHPHFPADGSKLDYFINGKDDAANQKRISYFTTLAGSTVTSAWDTRSATTVTASTYLFYFIKADGGFNAGSANEVRGIRPCIIYNSSATIDGSDVVYEPETVYRDVTAQANVERVIQSSATYKTALCKLSEQYSVAVITVTGSEIKAHLIDNNSGRSLSNITVASTDAVSISVSRLDNTHFAVQYIVNTNILYMVTFSVSGTSISKGNSSSFIDVSVSGVCTEFDLKRVLSIYNSATDSVDTKGLNIRVFRGSGGGFDTSYHLTGNQGANYISACKLPDDFNGNKRVCICFADAGDSNKGKVVIATIDDSNVVTFGDIVTFTEDSITKQIGCVYTDDGIYVMYFSTKLYITVLDVQTLNKISDVLNPLELATQVYGGIASINGNIVVVHGTFAFTVSLAEGTLSSGKGYDYNQSSAPTRPSIVWIGGNKALLTYDDVKNSMYGTTTLLEVSGNQIAGSFINNSKDAIALESGEGGEIIKLGFGGYCQCEGATSGQSIDSKGVTAFSPLDGWLKVIPWQEKEEPEIAPFVVGEYTGTGSTAQDSSQEIDVGFIPSFMIIKCIATTQSTLEPRSAYGIFAFVPGPSITNSVVVSGDTQGTVSVQLSGTTIKIYGGKSASLQLNEQGLLYRYIAFR